MRRRTMAWVAALAAAVALLASGSGLAVGAVPAGSGGSAAKPAQSWKLKLAISYFPSSGHHSQYDTVLAVGSESWFFGGSNFAGHGVPEVETRQHDRWRQSPLPHGLRSWIAAASAVSPRDIWAVSYLGGSVLHWDGSAWALVPKGRWNIDARFTGIVAFSANNAWLFGGKGRSVAGAGTWHWSGSKWTRFKGTAGEVAKASAASSTDIWGIGGSDGSSNALFQLRGSQWHQVSPSALSGFSYSAVLALGPANVWVAGTAFGTPELGHYDGHGWTALTMPAAVPASAMCRDGHGGLWVIANVGIGASVVLDRSGTGHWTTAKVSSTSANEVLGCALIPGTSSTWGVGKASAPKGTAAAVYGYGPTP